MNVGVIICGLERSVDIVMRQFENLLDKHTISFYLMLTTSKEKEYISYKNTCMNPNVALSLNFRETNNSGLFSEFRNSLHVTEKINAGIKLVNKTHDYYIIVRSDFICSKLNLEDDICDDDTLFIYEKSSNSFSSSFGSKRFNDGIIACKKYEPLKTLYSLHEYNAQNTNYFDKIIYDYIKTNEIRHNFLKNIDFKLVLSLCNVIAISGSSGSGKTTLSNILKLIFNDNATVLETDRYHKWERGDERYKQTTHLNPEANFLEKMNDDVFQLKIGNEVHQVDYDHTNGKFTQRQKLDVRDNIIVCGLHTLYHTEMNKIVNARIFVNTDAELMKKWKINRDVSQRGHTTEKVITQIKSREEDYNTHILSQKVNSDMIINYYENDNEELSCIFIINSDCLITRIMNYITVHKYKIEYRNNGQTQLYIYLKNVSPTIPEVIKIINTNKELFQQPFLYEIFEILYTVLKT